MRIAYLDCVGGISGDMFVGALLDAGWAEEALREGVAWLDDEIEALRVELRHDRSFAGRGIAVVPARRGAGAGHRRLQDVLALVERAPLPEPVIGRARAVFQRLAAAEARAHGRAVEKIHFHEVGEVDAIVDVTATCLGLHALGIERLHVSPLPLGSGRVTSAHGEIPLPAPATAYLLEGAPVRWSGAEGERCTPTGAALVATLGDWAPPPPMCITRVGCGVGTRPLSDMPNLARLFVGEACCATEGGPGAILDPRGTTEIPPWGWPAPDAHASRVGPPSPGRWGRVVLLRAQIDDATPEALADLAARLRGAGALDVWQSAVQMKQGRLGTEIGVVVRPGGDEPLVALLLRESPTLGVRWRLEWRRELVRREVVVQTEFGEIRGKLAWRGDRWEGKPEA
ncbi:MAG: DUF111 family protein, partial [Candidatus Eisenbacteria bacterium]|nr:DUF111 family protein [Candidatus Eisenbacteria bacterium]